MRYFFPFGGPGEFQHPQAHLSLHMGVGIPPGKDAPQAADFLHDWEFNALRLLAHPDRARMLRAMTGQAMSVQELSQTLGLNPGSVFRDLNNMKNVGLLAQEVVSNRIYYRTDSATVERLPGLPSIKNPLQKRRRHLTSSLSAGTIGMTSITFLTFGREAP